jgi:hypothetical protein
MGVKQGHIQKKHAVINAFQKPVVFKHFSRLKQNECIEKRSKNKKSNPYLLPIQAGNIYIKITKLGKMPKQHRHQGHILIILHRINVGAGFKYIGQERLL